MKSVPPPATETMRKLSDPEKPNLLLDLSFRIVSVAVGSCLCLSLRTACSSKFKFNVGSAAPNS